MPAARRVHFVLCQLFLVLVLVQFFLAGLGVFRAKPHGNDKLFESSTFDAHRAVGDVTQIAALLILIAAIVGVRDRLRLSLLLFVLAIVQGFLATGGGDAPILGALHPVNGLVLLALGHILSRPAREAEAPATAGPPTSATPTGTPPIT
jgi:Family of unknown function (DUF6220)